MKADLIIVSDIHIMERNPVCRTDPYINTQLNKLKWIKALQEKHKCKVVNAGDLFEVWKVSSWLLAMTGMCLPKQFYTIYGQHDLPNHSLKLKKKSGIYALKQFKVLKVLKTCSWGQEPKKESLKIKGRKILVWHYFNYQGAEPWPGCEAPTGNTLLKKYPQFDLIITGDNHVTFTKEYKGRLLVNPGSMTRHKADQIDHKPCVFLYYAKTNTVKKVYIPIKEGVVTREHIEEKEEKTNRITAFISSLDTEWDFSESLKKNFKKFFSKNKTSKKVIKIINKTLSNESEKKF